MGSQLIPYKSDQGSSKSVSGSDKSVLQTSDKKELKGYGDIIYVGGHKMYPKG